MALVASIFEAGGGERPWDDAVRDVTAWLGGLAGAVQIRVFWPELFVSVVMSGVDEAFAKSYGEHFFRVDPTWPHVDALKPGQTVASRDLVPDCTRKRSEFYNEWVEPQGLLDLLGAVLIRDERRAVSYATFGPAGHRFDERSRARLSALIPHLTKAMSLHLRLEELRSAQASLEAAGHLGLSWIRVDRELSLLDAGGSIDAVLGRFGGALTIERRRLVPGAGLAREDLVLAVTRATAGGSSRLRVRNDDEELELLVVPSVVAPAHAAEVLVLRVRGRDRSFDALPPSLRRVADLVSKGLSDKEISEKTSMPLATTRTYVSRVLIRLGAKSRRELMRRA